MKNLFYLLFGIVFIVSFSSCSGIQEKAKSYADDIVEAQLNGYSTQKSDANNNFKSWVAGLSDEKREQLDECWDETIATSFMNAFNEELTDIAEAIKGYSSWNVKSSYEKFEKRIIKIDEEYQESAEYSLSVFLKKYFKTDFEGYANSVFEAIKAEDKFGLERADKDFYKLCDRHKDFPSVVSAFKYAYKDYMIKEFEDYLKETDKETEKVFKTRDEDKITNYFKDKTKQFNMLFSKAGECVKEAYYSAYESMKSKLREEFN